MLEFFSLNKFDFMAYRKTQVKQNRFFESLFVAQGQLLIPCGNLFI